MTMCIIGESNITKVCFYCTISICFQLENGVVPQTCSENGCWAREKKKLNINY